ncbi:helix-turn-helix domain-containing protein [Streptomyces sp. NPDC050625]|uniref:TetR/AcrR family transcriptional regulator n=1 Tax=Streptomyces sp. NPDC050625 TaxID=3154629 RepID=UPI0034205F8C
MSPARRSDSRLRADAARNHALLLEAAASIVRERGAENLTMEAVAEAASVGKGTVFRRFGDRTGLMTALLDQSENAFQTGFLSHSPPLDCADAAVGRLRDFGLAALRRAADDLELQLAAEPRPQQRFTATARCAHHEYVTALLRQAVPEADCDLLARTLLGFLDPALVHHLTLHCNMPLRRLEEGWLDLVIRLTGTDGPCPGRAEHA